MNSIQLFRESGKIHVMFQRIHLNLFFCPILMYSYKIKDIIKTKLTMKVNVIF
jgi:hypothetical protein